MAVGVLCAVRGAAESLVVRAAEASAGRFMVTRRCADLTELLAAAEAGLGRVAIASAELDRLDVEAMLTLHRAGVQVVALADAARPWLVDRVQACGADLVVPTPDGLAGARTVLESATALLDAAVPDHPDLMGADAVLDEPLRRGRLVAVWGPTGAPGRTTVAVNLAAELAARGETSLLVDADTYGGTVAQVVGLLDEAPGLAAAARAAGQGSLDLRSLARLAPAIAERLRVLTGIARADRWPELPASALDVVWGVARQLVPWTLVDTGFCLEQDEQLSYDTRAPQRNAATLSALGAADVVVVVGAGDPVGLTRLVRALSELAELRLDVPQVVVVNRLRASATGARPEAAVHDALARYAGVHRVLTLPEDRAAADGALLAGRVLRECAPGSALRKALLAVVERLAAPVAVG
ncbi:MAG: hypothetical protein B7X40_09165 [Cellulomonas sp. 14-74-6]|nr:MAG: hypothetical protein B7X40_09165 [Cellulomonas sp. 14-74-6]